MKKKMKGHKKGLLITVCILCTLGIVSIPIAHTIAGTSTASKQDTTNVNNVKEATVTKGDLTAGVTESGSTAIGSATMDYSIGSVSQSSSSSGQSSSGSQSSSSFGAQSFGTSSSSSQSSTSSSSSSSSSSTVSTSLEIEKVHVTTSQVVKKGDILLTLTDESYKKVKQALSDQVTSCKLAVKEAQINSASEKATAKGNYSVNSSKSTIAQETYDNTVTKLKNAVKQAKKSYESKKTEIEDYQKSISEGKLDEKALSEAKTNLKRAKEELPNLKLQYAQAKTDQKSGLLEAKAQLEQDLVTANNADTIYSIETDGLDTSITEAKDNLADAKEALADFNAIVKDGTIVADFDGTITAFDYVAGDTLSSGSTIVTYGDATNVTITVSVDQEDVASIAVNDSVNLSFTAYPRDSYEGIVSNISTSPSNTNSSTVTYPVTVLVNGDVSQLYEGMTANVTFVSKELKDVLIVSNKAIHTEGTNSYVRQKQEDGTIVDTPVTTGFSDGNRVEIQDGLKEGDVVLIESKVVNK